jgi:hypothetical protein
MMGLWVLSLVLCVVVAKEQLRIGITCVSFDFVCVVCQSFIVLDTSRMFVRKNQSLETN